MDEGFALQRPFCSEHCIGRQGRVSDLTDGNDKRHCHGSDAITSSYRDWTKPPALIQAIANLGADQKARYRSPRTPSAVR